MKESLKKLSYPTWNGFNEPSPEFVDFCKSMVGECILMQNKSYDDDPEFESDHPMYVRILNYDGARRYFSCLLIGFGNEMYKLQMSIVPIKLNKLFGPLEFCDIYELPLEQFEDQMKKVMSMCQLVQDEVLQHA